MRAIYFILTLVFHATLIWKLKLLDNFYLILTIFFACLAIGLLVRYSVKDERKNLKELGWGLLFGSITSITLTVAFTIWLSVNFPK